MLVREEGPGILAWIIAGARAFYADGLAEPASVATATAEYAAGEDDLGRFVADRLALVDDADVVTDTRLVTAAYSRWCREEHADHQLTAQQLGKELRGRFGIRQRQSNGRRFYVGLSQLVDDDRPTYWQPPAAALPFAPLS